MDPSYCICWRTYALLNLMRRLSSLRTTGPFCRLYHPPFPLPLPFHFAIASQPLTPLATRSSLSHCCRLRCTMKSLYIRCTSDRPTLFEAYLRDKNMEAARGMCCWQVVSVRRAAALSKLPG